MLDLGGADSHPGLWSGRDVEATVLEGSGDPRLLGLVRSGERFDAILSVFQLVAAPDLDRTLERLDEVLAPGGQLLFLEPARQVGLARRLQAMAAPAVALSSGWHLERDLPFELRRRQWAVTDLDRLRFPTTQWWLRAGVEGRARPALLGR